ncbi:beta-N-acetylhexosaminidase [Ornithinibacillus sp. 4-3]|uniref:beta-N-acetylhexosaminidase n=1 Tax=Ornithinibacillus sp. 4-3 TaxID=3231488 RepID=A0AB39HPS4_9BACI
MRKIVGYLLLFGLLFLVIFFYFVMDGEEMDEKTAENMPKKKHPISEWIDDMTLDEKIGQLMFAGIDGTMMTDETKRLINDYKVGGIILFSDNIESQEQTSALLEEIEHENDQNNTPLFLGVDQEGGRVVRLSEEVEKLPTAASIGEQDNLDLSFEFGELLSKQVQLYGFNLDFAPVLDVNSNPNNPVIGDRSFGTRPEIVGEHGVEVMKGIQSENVIPVIKHFPGHGDTDTDSHLELPQVNKTLQELEELELLPFKQAIEAGADVVMTAHILLPEIDPDYPASISKNIIQGVLREELAFDGVVMTDDMTMEGLTNHFDIGEAAVQSIKAGTDVILVAHNYEDIATVFNSLKGAVENGDITEERLNESLTRILQLKKEYHLEAEKKLDFSIENLNSDIEEMLNAYGLR